MTLQRVVGTLSLLAVVAAGCGQLPTSGGQAPRPKPAPEAVALGLDGPGLNDEPTQSLIEPARPTLRPRGARGGNAAKLYASSSETLPLLKDLILSAKTSLWLETFNFGNDSMGQQIYPLLIQRAKEGLEVKVIADYVGSRFIKGHEAMAKQMRAAGIELRLYAPRFIMKDDKKRGINIDHRKLYVADGRRALVGGVNLMAPFDTHTEDVLVDWRGPIVDDLLAEYAFDWKATGGKPLTLPAPQGPAGTVTGRVVVTSPAEGRFEGREAIYHAVEQAAHEVRIANQYLWDDQLVQRLHDALARGVKVRIVVPGDEDHGVFKAIHGEELKKLVDHGAEARLFTGTHPEAHLHTKYFGVDDAWVAIGSTNGDTRALFDNQELDTVIEDRALAADFRDRMFQRDWTTWSKPFVYKPGGAVTKPFRKLLEIIDYYL